MRFNVVLRYCSYFKLTRSKKTEKPFKFHSVQHVPLFSNITVWMWTVFGPTFLFIFGYVT